MRSVRLHLVRWLTGTLLVATLALVGTLYAVTLDEMNEVLDDQLIQVALTVLTHYQGEGTPTANIPPIKSDLEDSVFITQVWTLDGRRVFVSMPNVDIPFSATEGFTTVATPDGAWRVYTDRSRHFAIQAAQPMEARHRFAADIALKILVPSLLALPLLGLLIGYALRRGLMPLQQASHDIEQRSAQSLDPIDTRPIPEEFQPLVESMNELIGKLSVALIAQRQFTADAAHELRTPLAALQLQVQVLLRAKDDAMREESAGDIRQGLARASHLVDQLLSLSRVEPDAGATVSRPVDLAALAKGAVAAFSVQADAHAVDLGADVDAASSGTCMVQGDAEQLRTLVNNLIDNALRHTPAAGVVDVRCSRRSDAVVLEVIDSGPGIPPSERNRVFDRFYRMASDHASAGTGLGLAIVKAIAVRHGASIELSDGFASQSGDKPGLAVRVVFQAGG